MTDPNYRLDKLDIGIARDGFILGTSRLGVDFLGAGSNVRLDASDQLTSLTIRATRQVDSGVWLNQETPTCDMTAKFEDTPHFMKGRRLVVEYRGQELYDGRVRNAVRAAQVDPQRPEKVRWSVAMNATDTGDRAVGTNYSPKTHEATQSITEALLARATYLSDVNVSEGVQDRVRTYRIGPGVADTQSVKEFFQQVERIASCLVVSDASSPSTVTLAAYTDGVEWTLRDDGYPSYSAAAFSENPLAATEVKVTPEGADPAEDYTGTTTLPGTVGRNDQAVTLNIPVVQAEAQAVVNSYPVIRTTGEYLSSVTLPFHEALDLSQPPSTVVLWLRGQKFTALVTGITHNITPFGWTINLECAPEYLGTRRGEAVPDPVTGLEATGDVITWQDPTSIDNIVVTVRTDSRWAATPSDAPTVHLVEPGGETLDLGLTTGTYRVTVWAMAVDSDKYSEPRTLQVVIP